MRDRRRDEDPWGQAIEQSNLDATLIPFIAGIVYYLLLTVEVIRKVLAGDERVLSDPAPVIAVGGLGDSSVDFVVRPWCRKEDSGPCASI